MSRLPLIRDTGSTSPGVGSARVGDSSEPAASAFSSLPLAASTSLHLYHKHCCIINGPPTTTVACFLASCRSCQHISICRRSRGADFPPPWGRPSCFTESLSPACLSPQSPEKICEEKRRQGAIFPPLPSCCTRLASSVSRTLDRPFARM